ncbi:MAG: hypothetical protein Q7S84_02495 [bacterium]|nr:hypothetical protein [bacterium]
MSQPERPWPEWCHHHGSKMRLAAKSITRDFVMLQGSAAEVRIQRFSAGWIVRWRIIQDRVSGVQGTVFFSDEHLRHAFCGDDHPFDFGGSIAKEYGATTGFQGVFIREGRYLNIPGPGTGHDGDPNVSIHLDDDTMKAVRRLLSFELRMM